MAVFPQSFWKFLHFSSNEWGCRRLEIHGATKLYVQFSIIRRELNLNQHFIAPVRSKMSYIMQIGALVSVRTDKLLFNYDDEGIEKYLSFSLCINCFWSPISRTVGQ